jgi:hypothetical protein
MKCRHYREWMLLNRPGELDGKSSRELEKHLAACPECRALRPGISRGSRLAGRAAELIRDSQPIPSAGMTDRILAAVAREKRPEPSRKPWTIPFLPARTGRLVLAGAAACAVLAFGMQEALVLSRVARLEDRLAALPSGKQPGVESGLESAVGIATGRPAADEWVTIRKSDLQALADRYPEDPEVRALIGMLEKDIRPQGGDEGTVRIGELIRELEKDPHSAEWMRQTQKRGGLPWNRI